MSEYERKQREAKEAEAKAVELEKPKVEEETTVMDDSREIEEDVEAGNLNSKVTGKAKHRICPDCGSKTQIEEGCVSCKACGWALCK